MLLNEAFKIAAGVIKPSSTKTERQLAREASKKVEMSFDASIDHLKPRDAARQAARSSSCKNASLEGPRLPFKERAGYLQEIIEDARARQRSRDSVLRVAH